MHAREHAHATANHERHMHTRICTHAFARTHARTHAHAHASHHFRHRGRRKPSLNATRLTDARHSATLQDSPGTAAHAYRDAARSVGAVRHTRYIDLVYRAKYRAYQHYRRQALGVWVRPDLGILPIKVLEPVDPRPARLTHLADQAESSMPSLARVREALCIRSRVYTYVRANARIRSTYMRMRKLRLQCATR